MIIYHIIFFQLSRNKTINNHEASDDHNLLYPEQFCDVIFEDHPDDEILVHPDKNNKSKVTITKNTTNKQSNSKPDFKRNEDTADSWSYLKTLQNTVAGTETQPMLLKADGMFSCSGCSYKSKHRGNVKMHIRTVHNRERPFACPDCKYSAPYKGKLISHIKAVHNKSKSYKCPKCSFIIFHKNGLREHILKEHSGHNLIKCPICPVKCVNENELKQHNLMVHIVKGHRCSECSYETSYKTTLKLHVISAHEQQKPHKCTLCPYSSSVLSSLTIHAKAAHNKEKAFACTICSYSTSYKGSLQSHMKNAHLKDTMFDCNICSFASDEKVEFDLHMADIHDVVVHTTDDNFLITPIKT